MNHFHISKIVSMLHCTLQLCLFPVDCCNDLAVHVLYVDEAFLWQLTNSFSKTGSSFDSITHINQGRACISACVAVLLRMLQAAEGHWQVKVIYFNQGTSHSVFHLLVHSYY